MVLRADRPGTQRADRRSRTHGCGGPSSQAGLARGEAGMKSFEQKYGYLLRLYPASYREQRGAEMLAVLAEHGRPSMRERGALVIGGLRARLEADDDRTVVGNWSAACYLTALTLLLAGVARRTCALDDRPPAPGCGRRPWPWLAPYRRPCRLRWSSCFLVERWPAAGPAFDRTVTVGRTPHARTVLTAYRPSRARRSSGATARHVPAGRP
jgi:hypothetical protein